MDKISLKKAFALANIDPFIWNSLSPMERKDKYKKNIIELQLKFHPDKQRGQSEDAMKLADINIRLLNGIDYNADTISEPSQSVGEPHERVRISPQDFFKEFIASIKIDIGQNKRFSSWKNVYEHYFTFPKEHKVNQRNSDDYENEFTTILYTLIYDRFVEDGRFCSSWIPPNFRYEEDLLIKISSYCTTCNITNLAAPELMLKESFWRKAIKANMTAVLYIDSILVYYRRYQNEGKLQSDSPCCFQALVSDVGFMSQVLTRYPHMVDIISGDLGDNEDLLNLTVSKKPISTLRHASSRLANVDSVLVARALESNCYSIEHVQFDSNNIKEVNAYRNYIKLAWESLPQKRPQEPSFRQYIMGEKHREENREQFIALVKEPFNLSLKVLFDTTQKLLEEATLFLKQEEIHRQEARFSLANLFISLYRFFVRAITQVFCTVFGYLITGIHQEVTNQQKIEAAKALIGHLENAYKNERQAPPSSISEGHLLTLKQTSLNSFIEQWQKHKTDLFTATGLASAGASGFFTKKFNSDESGLVTGVMSPPTLT